MPWNYDDEEINGIIDSNLKDSPPNPPAVNSAMSIRNMLKSMWAAMRGQVSTAVEYIDDDFTDQVDNLLTTVETRITAAEAKAQSVYNSFEMAKFKGKWDPATNTPTLTTVPSGNGIWYEVSGPGTSGVTGSSETFSKNDRLIASDTAWFRIDGAMIPGTESVNESKLTAKLREMVGEEEEYAIVNGKPTVRVFRDSNKDVYEAWFEDGTTLTQTKLVVSIANGVTIEQNGTTYILKNGTVEGEAPFGGGTVTVVDEAYVNGKKAIAVFRDANQDVYWCKYEDGTDFTNPAGLTDAIAEISAARGVRANLADRLSGVLSSRGMPTTSIWGAERLKSWLGWTILQNTPMNLVFIGDSYTQGSYYIQSLYSLLMGQGYANGGAGWCGFNRWGETSGSINQSVKSTLSVSYTLADWSRNTAANMGIDGYIVSLVANTVLTLTATEAAANVSILYEKHLGGGDFRWRIGAGAWTVVSTANATQDVSLLTIDTSGQGAAFTIQIEALAAGVTICGAIGRNTGNVLNVHKCGISGGTAGLFATNDLWQKSVGYLNPKLAVIMFATNEMGSNTPPATMKANAQAIVNRIRAINPTCDFVFGCPTYTKYETEEPKTYKLQDYALSLFELAQENNGAFINHGTAMGAFSQAQIDAGFMHSDRIHPGTLGGATIASNFFKLFKK